MSRHQFQRIPRLLCLISFLSLPILWATSARARAGASHTTARPAASCTAGPCAKAATTTPAVLRAQLSREMHIAGASSGAYVYDTSTHKVLFAQNASQSHPPASVEKLYTSTTALMRLGANAQLSTTVLGVGSLSPTGV